MNSILISGITGFVGGNLKTYLKDKHNVIGVSRIRNVSENIISYKELTPDYFNFLEAFIHLAGKAHDLKKVSSDEDYYIANTELTKSVFDIWLKSNSKIFIFMSSVKAVADKVEKTLTEDTIPNPKTIYGKSKLAAENYIRSKEIPKGKYVYILRPCMIHGPNNKGNLNLLYNIIKKGLPYPLGDFSNKRSFLAVNNLCFVIEQLIKNKPSTNIFNIADDEAISTNGLVKIIGEAINKNVKILKIPKPVIKVLAKFGDILPLPLNTERLNKLTENYEVSNKKIKEVIGVDNSFNTLEGIKLTIKSF